MRLNPSSARRRAISGILAGIILFAMLFTVGLGFFTYQSNLTNQYDRANALYQTSVQARNSEASNILAYPNKPASTLNVSAIVSNLGSNYVNLTALFIQDQTGRVACFTPLVGGLTNCNPYYGHTATKVTLPNTILNTGGATNITTDIRSTDASVSSCSTKTPCFVGVITSRGNVFTGTYPGPLVSIPSTIATTLNATSIGAGSFVHDTALLSGVSANAGGTVKYYKFSDGVCGAGQTLVSTQTVTNGVVPNSDSGQPSGTKFNSVGAFSWEAVYSGDTHNSGATSVCEPLTVSAQCTPSTSNFCFATVAQGIGSLAFDFNSFKWYSGGACKAWGANTLGQAPQNSCTLTDGLAGAFKVNTAPLAYTISQTGMTNAGSNLYFSVNVTNADPQKRGIVLDQFTQMWFSWFCPEVLGGNGPCAPGPHGQISATYYGLINMSNPFPSNPTSLNLPSMPIPYGKTVTMFFGIQENFAGTVPGIPLCGFLVNIPYSSQVTPVFIFFHGTIAGKPFGQDFPLASVLWTNIGAVC